MEQFTKSFVTANMLHLYSASTHGNLIAYIDGGTGSMLIQAAIAGVLTALYAAKNRIGQIRALISQRSQHKNSPQ